MAFYMDSYSNHLMPVTNNVTQMNQMSVCLGNHFPMMEEGQEGKTVIRLQSLIISFFFIRNNSLLRVLSGLETSPLCSVYKYEIFYA